MAEALRPWLGHIFRFWLEVWLEVRNKAGYRQGDVSGYTTVTGAGATVMAV